jgi:hypothetical protein
VIYNYKQYIHKQFVTHRIYERAAELLTASRMEGATHELVKKINNLDKQITEIVLASEQDQCPRQHESNWSIIIHQQSLVCKYWAVVLKGVRNKIDTRKRSLEVFDQLPIEHSCFFRSGIPFFRTGTGISGFC